MKPKSRLIHPSTRAFFQEVDQIAEYSFFDRLHGYVYGRWPYLYIGIALGTHPLAKILGPIVNAVSRLLPQGESDDVEKNTWADGYHGKVMPTGAAKQLVTINQEIRIDDLEQIIPYAKARTFILKNPDHIVALECPCRSARENPCLPLDVCLVIGEPFASFVVDHQPQRARWITQDEAAAILEAERDRGHVSHAFFKDAMLGRFYAICNCCACCCGAMNAHRNGNPMLASSGYVCQVDEDLCIGCGDCEEVCQFQEITVSNSYSVVDYEECMGCGVCVEHCQQEALSLLQDENKGIPFVIEELLKR
jgi:NAD-dependent dihydropyrimidine dehydrogenase PreA subunit